MPKAYLVSCYREIKDPEKLAGYAKMGGPAVVALAHYNSDAYQRTLGDGALKDMRIVESVE